MSARAAIRCTLPALLSLTWSGALAQPSPVQTCQLGDSPRAGIGVGLATFDTEVKDLLKRIEDGRPG